MILRILLWGLVTSAATALARLGMYARARVDEDTRLRGHARQYGMYGLDACTPRQGE